MERVEEFPTHLLRHGYSNQRCFSRPNEYKILTTKYHRGGLSERYECTWASSHYHYIILFDEQYVARQAVSHRSLIPGMMCKKKSPNLPLATLISYLEKYEDIDEETVVPKPKKMRIDEASIDMLKEVAANEVLVSGKRKAKLDQFEIEAEVRYQELKAMFPTGEESYKILQAFYKRAASRKLLEIDWKLYCSELQSETQQVKCIPITEEELSMMTSFPIFQRQIPRIITKIKNFIHKTKKTPIVVLHGVSNSGKSKYMKIIPQAMGKPHYMNGFQLTNDVLAMDSVVANACDILCFEEFRFVDFNNNISRALANLKTYSSGDFMNFRTAKNTKTKADAEVLIKGIWIASNEGREALNQYKNLDPAFGQRVVDIWFGNAIPETDRLDPEEYHANSNLLIKYAVYCWNREETEESESEDETMNEILNNNF